MLNTLAHGLAHLARLRRGMAPRSLARSFARSFARTSTRSSVRTPVANPDVEDLLRVARLSFVKLQAAWDAADLCALAALTTEPLMADLQDQLAARGPGPNCTEVLKLDARLLGIEELQEAFVASVEFSGVIRERHGDGAAPFRELWLLANLKATGRGWRLARVQALG
jgi:predicted lipid-binding transport protein (Tim44 family)